MVRSVFEKLFNSKQKRFCKVRFGSSAGLVWTIGIILFVSSLDPCRGRKFSFVNNRALSLAQNKNNEAPKLFFADTPDGSTSIIGNWFTFTSFTLSLGFFGLAFMIACIATASYYVLVVVTEPSQQVRRMDLLNAQPYSSWDWERILRLINLAYQTYTTLDVDSMECQNKILCELQESQGIVGRTTRRVSNFLMYFNLFKSIPHIREYQEAIERGQKKKKRRRTGDADLITNSTSNTLEEDSCASYYKECHFSVNHFNHEYNQLFPVTSDQSITST